jgi:selenide, water dikinase
MSFDLLTTVEAGGCSAKLSPKDLAEILKTLPKVTHPDLIVDIETHDDAGVFRITDDIALVQTVDFFPPVCSDPYDFGQIAAANALSDVYAMGGKPLTALNIMMFPGNRIPRDVFTQILLGGQDKVTESGAVIVGGHTIDDYPPKYGLSVTGLIHPKKVITNAGAKPGDVMILTKPIGTGIIIAARRTKLASDETYHAAIASMKELNMKGAQIMQKHGVRSATDITGFSLIGHALKMASASGVTIEIDSSKVPLLPDVYSLADKGVIPGAAFRNMDFAENECSIDEDFDYTIKMILFDPQTSGGLFICALSDKANLVLSDLHAAGVSASAVGRVVDKQERSIRVF